MEKIVGKARPVGNSSGVLLPKEWLNKKVVVTIKEPSEKEILHEIIEILYNYGVIKNVLGIYLVGSYARGKKEITIDSDIDLLIITKDISKTIEKDNYQIILIKESALLKNLKEMPFHYYPMIYEAKPLLNDELLASYKKTKIDLKSSFIKDTKKMLEKSKEMINLDKKLGNKKTGDSVAYSLILRLRGIYIIDKLSKKQLWRKNELLKIIKGVTGNLDMYKRYLYVKKGGLSHKSLYIEDAEKMIDYIEKEILKWENMKKGKEKRS
jgi:predicted nucleotidyltransferase